MKALFQAGPVGRVPASPEKPPHHTPFLVRFDASFGRSRVSFAKDPISQRFSAWRSKVQPINSFRRILPITRVLPPKKLSTFSGELHEFRLRVCLRREDRTGPPRGLTPAALENCEFYNFRELLLASFRCSSIVPLNRDLLSLFPSIEFRLRLGSYLVASMRFA